MKAKGLRELSDELQHELEKLWKPVPSIYSDEDEDVKRRAAKLEAALIQLKFGGNVLP